MLISKAFVLEYKIIVLLMELTFMFQTQLEGIIAPTKK